MCGLPDTHSNLGLVVVAARCLMAIDRYFHDTTMGG